MANEEKLIRNLAKEKAQGTQLITYYVPGDRALGLLQDHVRKEIATARNIKSRTTGKAVMTALKCIQKTVCGGKCGDNGLVICAGNLSTEYGPYV